MTGRRIPFSVLAKPTGSACNLDCTYCFFLSKELLYEHERQRMSDEQLETYLRNLFDSQPIGPVEVSWQGGEPTMRGLDFFRRAVALSTELARPGQQVRHVLQTNGVLLDDAWGAFLAEHGFLVGLSIDGPAELHDAYRVDTTGAGSHGRVVEAWELLRRHGVDTNILCTVHAANQDRPLEVYRYFRDGLGADWIQFIPIVERVPVEHLELAERGWRSTDRGPRSLLYRQHGDAVTSRSVSPEAYGEFLVAVFDEWAANDVGTVFVRDVDVALGNLFGRPSLCVHSPTCGAAIAVEHNGDVYSCDHYVEPDHKLGNVADTSFTEMLAGPQQVTFGRSKLTELPRQCVDCDVRWACHGGCPKDRFAHTADGEPGLNHLCAGYKRFFGHAQPTLERLAVLVRSGRPPAEIMAPAPGSTPGAPGGRP